MINQTIPLQRYNTYFGCDGGGKGHVHGPSCSHGEPAATDTLELSTPKPASVTAKKKPGKIRQFFITVGQWFKELFLDFISLFKPSKPQAAEHSH
jgi:hypothetical protein